MKNVFFICIFMAMHTFAFAEGWTSVHGKNSQGATVTWEYTEDAGEFQGHRFVKGRIEIEKNGELLQTYVDQKCSFDIHVKNLWGFSCIASGASPLAGVTYLIDPILNKNDKRSCSGIHYSCYKGCKRFTPRHMYKEPWEC